MTVTSCGQILALYIFEGIIVEFAYLGKIFFHVPRRDVLCGSEREVAQTVFVMWILKSPLVLAKIEQKTVQTQKKEQNIQYLRLNVKTVKQPTQYWPYHRLNHCAH